MERKVHYEDKENFRIYTSPRKNSAVVYVEQIAPCGIAFRKNRVKLTFGLSNRKGIVTEMDTSRYDTSHIYLSTENPDEVTCKTCQKHIVKQTCENL